MNDQNNSKEKGAADYTGAVADAFFMANLLFIGIFYLILWGFYFIAYKNASQVSKNHIKQALATATISTLIVIILNVFIISTVGYASATALIAAEVYLMLIVPLFMIVGIMAFTKAINEKDYKFPIIGKLLGVSTPESK